jgi:hypothetical protein
VRPVAGAAQTAARSGGATVRLTDKLAFIPKVSPDGRAIACFYQARPAAAVQLAIIPFAGGALLKTFDLPPTTVGGVGLRWLPDGSALTYVDN